MDNKTDLRISAKVIRKNLDIGKKSKIACEKIRSQSYYQNAKNVLLFYPMKYEINMLDLLNDNKNFYLPKVNAESLFVCPFELGDELNVSDFNCKEPCSYPVNPDIIDLIVVPALMVDKNHYRLGYGGGFYDRFLAKYSNKKTVIPIAKELIIEKLPFEDFDIKCDYIIEM